MTNFSELGAEIWRDFETDGDPSSGPHNPVKSEIRTWATTVENLLALDTRPIDVYLIGGQSNAQGNSPASSSPAVPDGVLQYNGAIAPANDPVGNANTCSAWPSFGITYAFTTGRQICFVPAAVGGSAQMVASDTGQGNWDASGTLYGLAVAALNNALAALTAAGYDPTFRGVLWDQGESEADNINASTPGVSQAGYEAALKAMLVRFRSTYGAEMPFYIFRIGTRSGSSDTGFSQIRAAQEDVAATDPYTFIVFRNALSFVERALLFDAVHYTQAGYNEMGRVGAAEVVARSSESFQRDSNGLWTLDPVGIGTALPGSGGQAFDLVNPSSSGQARVRYDTVGSGLIVGQISSGGPVYLNQQANDDLRFSTHNIDRFYLKGDGGLISFGATGGSQGAGTINAAGMYVNGVAVVTSAITITLTGDVTGSSASPITTTLANIPSGVAMAGRLLATNIAAPSTPASGKTSIYVDSTQKVLSAKNDAGTVSITAVPSSAGTHQFATGLSAAGVISYAQPAFTDISGSVAASQMPALTGDVTTTAGTVATTVAKIAGTTVSGTTGSTNAVFSGSPTIATPTITTSVTCPLVIGGTGAGASLSLQSTSNGTPSGDTILFKSGSSTVAQIGNTGGSTYGMAVGPGSGLAGGVALILFNNSSNGQMSMRYDNGANGILFSQTSSGGPFIINQQANNYLEFDANNGSVFVRLSAAGGLSVNSTTDPGAGSILANGQFYGPNIATTASAANAFIDTGTTPVGQLKRSTSSLVYKRDVETLDDGLADKLLELRPIWYRSAVPGDRQDWSWYGIAAEEAAAVDPRLVHWGYGPDDYELVDEPEPDLTNPGQFLPPDLDPATGRCRPHRRRRADATLRPEGVQYERLSVLLLSIVKRQDARIAALEAHLPH